VTRSALTPRTPSAGTRRPTRVGWEWAIGFTGAGHAVLGRPAPATLRPLVRGERGIMAAILLSALTPSGFLRGGELWALCGAARFGSRSTVIGGSVRTAAGLTGRVLLVIPVGWLADAAQGRPGQRSSEGLAVGATLELAEPISLGAAVALRPPWATQVVFDGVVALETDGPGLRG